jgi:anti-sigma28 factor (negative regulator of flagellin synthesis)
MTDVRGVGGIQPTEVAASRIHRVQQPAQTHEIQDTVEISARSLKAAEIATYSEVAKTSPDIRPEVVEKARQRVESGEYFEDRVTRAVAEKIVDSL